MSKRDKCFEWRLEGMYYAANQIEQNGLDAFRDELKFRKASGVKVISKTRAELDEFMWAIIRSSLTVMVSTLVDEFDFTHDQCEQFMKRFNLKIRSLARSDITWEEQWQLLEDESDIHVRGGEW